MGRTGGFGRRVLLLRVVLPDAHPDPRLTINPAFRTEYRERHADGAVAGLVLLLQQPVAGQQITRREVASPDLVADVLGHPLPPRCAHRLLPGQRQGAYRICVYQVSPTSHIDMVALVAVRFLSPLDSTRWDTPGRSGTGRSAGPALAAPAVACYRGAAAGRPTPEET